MPQGAGAVTSSNILEPFNIPTTVGGGPPIQKPPAPNLTFPVFTPPAASSYGTTNPEAVPWTPPDLAGAINKGIETGAHLATDAFTNRKTLSQISAQEQAQKIAIAQQSQPGAAERTSVSGGPEGFSFTQFSPAELALKQAEMEARRAEIAATTTRTALEAAKSPAEIARETAEAAKAAAEAREHGTSGFDQATGRKPAQSASGANNPPAGSGTITDWTGGI